MQYIALDLQNGHLLQVAILSRVVWIIERVIESCPKTANRRITVPLKNGFDNIKKVNPSLGSFGFNFAFYATVVFVVNNCQLCAIQSPSSTLEAIIEGEGLTRHCILLNCLRKTSQLLDNKVIYIVANSTHLETGMRSYDSLWTVGIYFR